MADSAEVMQRVAMLSLSGPREPFLVFADWLTAQGDPWGELITVMCAVEQGRAELAARCDALLITLGPRLCPMHEPFRKRARWKRGFATDVSSDNESLVDALDGHLRGLAASPACALIETVRLEGAFMRDDAAPVLLAHRAWLARRALVNLKGNFFGYEVAARLKAAIPCADVSAQRVVASVDLSVNQHRAFIRAHGGPRSIDDIDD